jgi:hypothetical protein
MKMAEKGVWSSWAVDAEKKQKREVRREMSGEYKVMAWYTRL